MASRKEQRATTRKKTRYQERLLPDKYPDLKIIYPHGGLPYYKKLWEYIKNKPSVYVDLSAPYLDFDLRKLTVNTLGAQKCLYGSDGPYGYEDDDGNYSRNVVIDEIYDLPISDNEKDLILSDNFMKIIER